jgi:hypothetical protein
VSRRALQAAIAVLACIPVTVGLMGVIQGPGEVMPGNGWPVNLDSHYRFLSGIFLAIGLAFWWCAAAIERRTAAFRLLCLLIFTGGLGRGLSLVLAGPPSTPHLVGLGFELVLVPVLAWWQGRVADASA